MKSDVAKVQRYIPLEINIDAIKKTPEGFLILPVTATRTGVLPYIKGDGTLSKEARLPQDVFAQESLDSMRSIPVTNDHPSGLVNASNASKLTKGWTGSDVRARDGKFIETTVKIVDQATIDDVMNGKVQVSAGYEVDKDETPGRFDNEDFDVIQKNIRYNHLAIVTRGRAGPEVKLRLDTAGNEVISIKGETMKVKIKDQEFELADALGGKWNEMQKHMDECSLVEKKMKDAADAADVARADAVKATESLALKQKEIDTLQAKFDAANSEIEKIKKGESHMDASEVQKIAREITRANKVAEIILDEKECKALSEKDVSEIKKAVIKKDAPGIDEKKLESAAYVDARFDAIADKALASNRDQLAAIGRTITLPSGAEDGTADKSRIKQNDEALKEWQKPLSVRVA